MKPEDLRKLFIDFFVQRGHKLLPNVNLVPEDPSTLFTSAGMQPLTPYLLGEPHPLGKRLVSNQRCLRVNDIDEVGDNRHLTFFEMLGNWSLGDYFKKEQLNWAFEFLTSKKWLKMDPVKLYVSVFEGDEVAPRDEESVKIWQDIFKKAGIEAKIGERICFYPREKNWWETSAPIGPGGPDSEVFYDIGKKHNPAFGSKCHINCDCGKFVEVWNNVFMEYNKKTDGSYEPLEHKNVDTGLGFERVLAVLNNKETPYETVLFSSIISRIESLSSKSYRLRENKVFLRIIADHLRASVFLIADNIIPSNVKQGYILRRLIRRAIRAGMKLEIRDLFTPQIAQLVINDYQQEYPHLEENEGKITEELEKEEKQFREVLKRGLKVFEKQIPETEEIISGEKAFDLYQTYGFPLELIQELAQEKGLTVDEKGFQEALKKHQEKSRVGARKLFRGGLAGQSVEEVKLHTATHLLQAALRKILGTHIQQEGSNITPERLRFDFSHPESLTPEEIKKIEDLVNQKIREDLLVKMEITSLEEAKKQGALAFFGEKYGEKVKVYMIGEPSTSSGRVFSKEICGGPHIKSTGQLGKFKIKSEKGIGKGLRRIKAVLTT